MPAPLFADLPEEQPTVSGPLFADLPEDAATVNGSLFSDLPDEPAQPGESMGSRLAREGKSVLLSPVSFERGVATKFGDVAQGAARASDIVTSGDAIRYAPSTIPSFSAFGQLLRGKPKLTSMNPGGPDPRQVAYTKQLNEMAANRQIRLDTDSPLNQWGKEQVEFAKKVFKGTPDTDDTFTTMLAESAGGMLPDIALSTVPVVGPELAVVSYGLQSGAQQAQEAIAAGRPETADVAFVASAGLGALSERLLGVAPKFWQTVKALRASGAKPEVLGNVWQRWAAENPVKARILTGGLREGVQEGPIEQVGQNLIASDVAGYDPQRPIMQGVPAATAAGAVLGGVVGGGEVAISQRMDAQAEQQAFEQASTDAAKRQALEATIPEGAGVVQPIQQATKNRARFETAGKPGLFNDLPEESSEAQPPSAETVSNSRPPEAVATPAPAGASQADHVRAELEALPGAEQDLAEASKVQGPRSKVAGDLEAMLKATEPKRTLTSEQTDAGLREPADNVPATKADLAALANFIQNGGPNPFAKPGQPETSNAQRPTSNEPNIQAAVPNAAAGNGQKVAQTQVLPQTPKANAPSKPVFSVGQRVAVTLSAKSGKQHMARIIQLQPDGSAQVKLEGEKTYRMVQPNQFQLSKTDQARLNKQEEMASVPAEQQAQVKSDAAEFDQLVEDYAPVLEWAPGEAYDRNTAMQEQGVANAGLRRRAVERALRAAGSQGQANSVIDRAAALPALEAYLKQKFPGDNSIAKRRALEQFSRTDESEATSPTEQQSRVAADAAYVARIVAGNPGVSELQGLQVYGQQSQTAGQNVAGNKSGSPAVLHATVEGHPGGPRRGKALGRGGETKVLRELERLFGVRIILVEDSAGGQVQFNGYKDRGSNVVLVAHDAQVLTLAVAGHEIGHHIELTHPGLYKELKAALRPMMQNVPKYRSRLEQMGGYEDLEQMGGYEDRQTGKVEADTVEREMINDFIGDNLANPDFMAQLAQQEPNLFKRFARIVVKWLDKLIAKAKGIEGYQSAQYFKDLTQAREVVARALVDAARQTQYQKAGIVEQEQTEGMEDGGEFSKSAMSARSQILKRLKRGEIEPAVGEPAEIIAIWEMMDTLEVPEGWVVKDTIPSKYGSAYWKLEDRLGEPWKISVRDHDFSPAREKEFGASDDVAFVKDASDPKQFAEGMSRIESSLRKNDEFLEEQKAKREAEHKAQFAAKQAAAPREEYEKAKTNVEHYRQKVADKVWRTERQEEIVRELLAKWEGRWAEAQKNYTPEKTNPENVLGSGSRDSQSVKTSLQTSQDQLSAQTRETSSEAGADATKSSASDKSGSLRSGQDVSDGGQYSNPEKPLLELTQDQFDRKYSIHFDVRDGAADRVESIMRDGLRSGMVSSDIDNKTPESIYGKNAMARGWARFASVDKPGAIAYVIRNTDLRGKTIYVKPGTKPVAVVRLTKENQSVYEALQEQGAPMFSKRDDLFGAPESVEEQRARLKQESEAQKLKKAKEGMQERAGAKLTGADVDTTKEMFGAEVKQDKAGQGSLFSKAMQGMPLFSKTGPFDDSATTRAVRSMLRGQPVPKEFRDVQNKYLGVQKYFEEALRLSIVAARKRVYQEFKTQADREAAMDRLGKYWLGQIPLASVGGPTTQLAAQTFRNDLDSLAMTAAANGMVPDSQVRTWIGNTGEWLKRTYLAFDPTSDWNYDQLNKRRAKEPEIQRIWTNAENYLRTQNPKATPGQIEAEMRSLIDRREVESALFGRAPGESRGGYGADTSSLIKRKNIPPEILEWMGQIQDPIARAQQSAKWMSQFLARNLMQRELAKVGLEAGWFTQKAEGRNHVELYPNVSKLTPVIDPATGAVVQTPSGNIEAEYRTNIDRRHEPLHGLYTSPEMMAALQQFDGMLNTGMAAASRLTNLVPSAILKGVGFWKMGKVALNPISYPVNSFGAIVMRLMAGAANPLHVGNALLAVASRRAVIDKNSSLLMQRARANYLLATKQGITGKGIFTREIDASFGRESEPQSGRRAIRALADLVTGRGAGGARVRLGRALMDMLKVPGEIGIKLADDVARVSAFLDELKLSKQANPTFTDQQHADWAAERAGNIYQTYENLSVAIRDASNVGVLSPFISFTAEMFRNAAWVAYYGQQGLRSDNPALRRDGAQKLAGLAAMTALPIVLAALSRGNADDDEDKAKRKVEALQRWFVPPWDRGEDMMIVSFDKNRVTYIPMSYLLPTAQLSRIPGQIAKISGNENPTRAINQLVDGAMQDVFGSGPIGTAIEALTNTRGEGRKITRAEGLQGWQDRAAYAWKNFRPGVAQLADEWMMAQAGEKGFGGREYTTEEIGMKLAGLRMRTVSPKQAIPFVMRDFNQRWRDASAVATLQAERAPKNKEAIKEAQAYKAAKQAEIKKDYAQFLKDAELIGWKREQVMQLAGEEKIYLPKELKD